jgi:hypothetical protein
MGQKEDIWYAANSTRVILQPRQTLETFGTTTIKYHVVSELMDEINQVRVRAGKVYSERPQIITPTSLGQELLEGFGDKAREYADFLMSHGEMMGVLKYGLRFRKDETAAEIVHESIDIVADRVKAAVENDNEPLTAVLIGADELWEVSLLKFVVDYIQRSAPSNLQDLTQRAHGEASESNPKISIHDEIEADFATARIDPRRVNELGNKLQRYGLFETYEDRFYALMPG